MNPILGFECNLLDWNLDHIPELQAGAAQKEYWSKVHSDFNQIVGNLNDHSHLWQVKLQEVEDHLTNHLNLEELIIKLAKRPGFQTEDENLMYLLPFLKAVQAELYEYSNPDKAHEYLRKAFIELRRLEPTPILVQIENKLTCLSARMGVRSSNQNAGSSD